MVYMMIRINLVSTKVCKSGHTRPALKAKCPACVSVSNSAWYSSNKAAENERSRAYYRKNKAIGVSRSLEWYRSNRDHCNERNKRWLKDNARQKARSRFAANIKTVYGLTVEDYARMVHAQSRKCVACGATVTLGMDTALDHCHATGRVRGILCAPCNKSLGLMKESPEKIRVLAAYIERFK